MPKELKIIQDFYDFMLWITKHTEKFPRHHRYSLGVSIETRLQKILELLLKAKYHKEKNKVLNDANIELVSSVNYNFPSTTIISSLQLS